MALRDKDHIARSRLACHDSGDPDLETVLTISPADRSRLVLCCPVPAFAARILAVTKAKALRQRLKVPVR